MREWSNTISHPKAISTSHVVLGTRCVPAQALRTIKERAFRGTVHDHRLHERPTATAALV
jgi:hypothetical protein